MALGGHRKKRRAALFGTNQNHDKYDHGPACNGCCSVMDHGSPGQYQKFGGAPEFWANMSSPKASVRGFAKFATWLVARSPVTWSLMPKSQHPPAPRYENVHMLMPSCHAMPTPWCPRSWAISCAMISTASSRGHTTPGQRICCRSGAGLAAATTQSRPAPRCVSIHSAETLSHCNGRACGSAVSIRNCSNSSRNSSGAPLEPLRMIGVMT